MYYDLPISKESDCVLIVSSPALPPYETPRHFSLQDTTQNKQIVLEALLRFVYVT